MSSNRMAAPQGYSTALCELLVLFKDVLTVAYMLENITSVLSTKGGDNRTVSKFPIPNSNLQSSN